MGTRLRSQQFSLSPARGDIRVCPGTTCRMPPLPGLGCNPGFSAPLPVGFPPARIAASPHGQNSSAESLARHLPAPGPALNPLGRRWRRTQVCRAKDPALLPCVSSRRAGSACPERVQNNQPPSHRAGGSASGAVRTREMWPCRPGSAQPFHRAGGRAQFARRLFLFLRRARRIRRSGRIVAPSL